MTTSEFIDKLNGYIPYLLKDEHPWNDIHVLFLCDSCYFMTDIVTHEDNCVKLWLDYADLRFNTKRDSIPRIRNYREWLGSDKDINKELRVVFPIMNKGILKEGVFLDQDPFENEGSLCFKIRSK